MKIVMIPQHSAAAFILTGDVDGRRNRAVSGISDAHGFPVLRTAGEGLHFWSE
jgi:hypothetical protein